MMKRKIRRFDVFLRIKLQTWKVKFETFLIKYMLKFWHKITVDEYQKLIEIDINSKLSRGQKTAKQIEIAFNKEGVYNWSLDKVKYYVDSMYFLLSSPEKVSNVKNNINFDDLKYEDYIICEQMIVSKKFNELLKVLTNNDNIGKEKITKHIDTVIEYLKWSQSIKKKFSVIYPPSELDDPDMPEEYRQKLLKNKKPITNVVNDYYQLVYNIGDERITDIDYILQTGVKRFYQYASVKINKNKETKAKLKAKGLIK